MKIEYHKNFEKSYRKKDFFIRKMFQEKLKIFIRNPFETLLSNHSLEWKKYRWCRSINVTWDFRAVFKEHSNWTYEFIEFIDIWTHSELYW